MSSRFDVRDGPVLGVLPSRRAFTRSTARIAAMADGIRTVYMAHFTRYVENAAFVREVAQGFAAIAAGDVQREDSEDDQGEKVRACWFARFGVFVHPDAV